MRDRDRLFGRAHHRGLSSNDIAPDANYEDKAIGTDVGEELRQGESMQELMVEMGAFQDAMAERDLDIESGRWHIT